MNINFREPSTKRGIGMIITGCIVLYQTIWGSGQFNIDALFSRVDWWLGVGLNIVGMLGLLPDRDSEKRTRATDLPPTVPVKNAYDIALEESVCVDGLDRESVARPFKPPLQQREIMNETDLPNIELQGHSESVTEDRRPAAADQPEWVPPADRRLRLDVPPGHRTQPESDERGSDDSWHGFNDR